MNSRLTGVKYLLFRFVCFSYCFLKYNLHVITSVNKLLAVAYVLFDRKRNTKLMTGHAAILNQSQHAMALIMGIKMQQLKNINKYLINIPE